MKHIRRTSDIVKNVLELVPEARDDDDLLYVNVCQAISPMICHQPFGQVMMLRRTYKIPPYESVRRTRQKLQASYPELRGSDEAEAQRVVNEGIVKDYARSVSV